MKEILDIIKAFDEAQQQQLQTALVTLVHVEGSSYRRPGARMLVRVDGELTGAISGGCLEGDALRKALLAMAQKKPMLVTYDTNDEDDAILGMGLGCNGIIQVLIEPIEHTEKYNPVEFLKTLISKRQKAILITLFSLSDKKATQPGTCLLYTEEGFIAGNSTHLNDILLNDTNAALLQQQSYFKNYIFENRQITAFIEIICPPVSLIILGAGNDVLPLVEMAGIIGWHTTVIDGRPAYAKAERFGSTCQVLVSKPENVLSHIVIDEQTVFVLMTHNYNYDIAALKGLLQLNPPYVGALGPKKKLERMLDELKEQGVSVTDESVGNIFGPTGLDVGAETADEIALSIISEIKAVLSA